MPDAVNLLEAELLPGSRVIRLPDEDRPERAPGFHGETICRAPEAELVGCLWVRSIKSRESLRVLILDRLLALNGDHHGFWNSDGALTFPDNIDVSLLLYLAFHASAALE
jgi:hypothetical protein